MQISEDKLIDDVKDLMVTVHTRPGRHQEGSWHIKEWRAYSQLLTRGIGNRERVTMVTIKVTRLRSHSTGLNVQDR